MPWHASELVFTIASVVILLVFAVVVFRLVWLRRVRTESYLHSSSSQAPQLPREQE